MSASWVAAAVRARGLLDRRLGPDRTSGLGAETSLDEAVTALADSSYGRYVHRGMTLADAERAVDATVLWHMRILAGWGPALSGTSLRLLAGGFEIENIEDLLLRFAGAPVSTPFELGALSLSWSRLAGAGSAGELRRRLAESSWGDPGAEDLGTVRFGLRLVWAQQVANGFPFLRRLAVGAARLAVARADAESVILDGRALRIARSLIASDPSSSESSSLPAREEPSTDARMQGRPGSDRLWETEVQWWSQAESTASTLSATSNPSESMVVGVVLLLAVDAWRVRAALETAAAREMAVEAIDALA